MRIFLQGNQDLAKWHLPVAEAKFNAFVERCKENGLKQDRFTFIFSEDGTTVFGQYFYGKESLQIYAPTPKIPLQEKSKDDVSVEMVKPKVFYVNTAQGYFWIEVRYIDNIPTVILTPFKAIVNDDFVYPGFMLNSPGMFAGNFDNTLKTRYVLAQNGGVIGTVENTVGIIKSVPITNPLSKITVVSNTTAVHDFILMKSDSGKTAEIRRIKISTAGIERFYSSIDMVYEGETGLNVNVLHPNPCWIHRKCLGSYFSPNKTIGYHVDIGIDDNFLGNISKITDGDLLDNTGGANESLFNHTPDLYRFASLFCFPISVDETSITIIMVSPTMMFMDNSLDSKKCWGGYGITQTWASCVDYQQDFSSWYLSPRLIEVNINTKTGEKVYTDPSVTNYSKMITVFSWDGSFSGSVYFFGFYGCDTEYYNNTEITAGSSCTWESNCVVTCDTNDPGSLSNCPKNWTPYDRWKYYSREDILNKKGFYFLFGKDTPVPFHLDKLPGYYFLFDSLWHLDIGVYWTNAVVEGNSCGLCSYPLWQQDPGGYITFSVVSADLLEIMENGTEFVENLEIVSSLGWHPWPLGGTVFGFVAKVPDKFAAPHEPVIMTGGIEYTSKKVPDITVRCSRSLRTNPCICDGNVMYSSHDSYFELHLGGWINILGGCAPFTWSVRGGHIDGKQFFTTNQRTFTVTITNPCAARVRISDACGTVVSFVRSYARIGVVVGPHTMSPGTIAYFATNLENAVYTGSLEVVTLSPTGDRGIFKMPENVGEGGSRIASWTGRCGTSATKTVYNLYDGNRCLMPVCGPGDPSVGDIVSLGLWGTSPCSISWPISCMCHRIIGPAYYTGYNIYANGLCWTGSRMWGGVYWPSDWSYHVRIYADGGVPQFVMPTEPIYP